jgi:hypothetical protein
LGREIKDSIGFTDDQIRESMYDGVRMAQDLCYCRDWDRFKAIKLSPDPFGRDLKKVRARMVGAVLPTPAGMTPEEAHDHANWLLDQVEELEAQGLDEEAEQLATQALNILNPPTQFFT